MELDYSQQYDSIAEFFGDDVPASQKVFTLGGCGPNGSSQVPLLNQIGVQNLKHLHEVNIVSGSSYAYCIFDAFQLGHLKEDNYIVYDRLMRKLHKASFFRGCKHLAAIACNRTRPLYQSEVISGTTDILFEKAYTERSISSLPPNIKFWAYCSNLDKCIEISHKTFPDMTLRHAIMSCVCVRSLYGEFEYQEHKFSDPIYSSQFRNLKQRLTQTGRKSLYFNFVKSGQSGDTRYVINQKMDNPKAALRTDFANLILNLHNKNIDENSRFALEAMKKTRSEEERLGL